MRCLAVCQDELVIRMLDEILLPGFEVEFLVESRPLARRLHDAGVHVIAGDPAAHRHLPQGRHRPQHLRHHRRQRPPQPQEDPRRRSATPAARSSTCSASAPRRPRERAEEFHAEFPDVAYLSMSELFGGPLLTEFSRSLTRARVQQYQRYFADADRVLILLHNDPDPDAMASGLALRNVLRRTKTTAIIGAMQGVTRPENLRMVEPARHPRRADHRRRRCASSIASRWSTCSRTTSAACSIASTWSSTIIPSSPATPRSSRTSAPTTDRPRTILTEHLRAVDVNISERTATAMLYAIKSDTLFFDRQTNRVDLEAFSFLYPLADAALIRKMEGAEITLERLDYVIKAQPGRHAARPGVLRVPRRRRRARTSSPTSPTSSCSSRTSSGRSSPASSTTR